MANLFDYLKWRGDISMEYDRFNEVDNLLFSQLSYIDFGGIVPSLKEGGEISLEEAYEIYYQHHTKEEILERKSFVKMCVFLMDDMVGSVRYKDIKIGGFINEYDEGKVKQLCAMYFILPDDSIYVAFRGTDESVTGWKEDFYFSFVHGTNGQKSGQRFLQQCLERFPNRKIRVGGHSKGGNFALYAAIYAGEYQDQIIEVWCNDSPGMMKEVYQEEGFLKIKDRIRCIIPDSSLVGVLMTSPVSAEVVESSENGIMQHDGNTWQIQGNSFIKLDTLSDEGMINDLAIHTWLKNISLEERKEFIDIVFSILEDNDITNFTQLDLNITKWLPALNSSIKQLSKEEQDHVKEMVIQLIKTYLYFGKKKKKKGETSMLKSILPISLPEFNEDSEVVLFFKNIKDKFTKG